MENEGDNASILLPKEVGSSWGQIVPGLCEPQRTARHRWSPSGGLLLLPRFYALYGQGLSVHPSKYFLARAKAQQRLLGWLAGQKWIIHMALEISQGGQPSWSPG